MSELLILSTSLRKVVRQVALLFVAFTLSPGCMAGGALTADDLKNPDILLAHRQNVTAQDREMAKKLYQHALQAATKDSASAVKSFSESALIYPTSSALMELAEHRAKMLAKRDDKIKRNALADILSYLTSAQRLNAVDKLLANSDLNLLVEDQVCTEQFLANKPMKDNCRPVQWIGLY